MNIEKKIENIQTGWVKWHNVEVYLQKDVIICKVEVENQSNNYPVCLVNIKLKNSTLINFKFGLTPHKIEKLELAKRLTINYEGIEIVELDEE